MDEVTSMKYMSKNYNWKIKIDLSRDLTPKLPILENKLFHNFMSHCILEYPYNVDVTNRNHRKQA